MTSLHELMRSWWMKHAHQGVFSHVTVHDVKKRKEVKGSVEPLFLLFLNNSVIIQNFKEERDRTSS